VRTAYPRVSKVFDDPTAGLASIEALYLARKLLGDDDPSLLDGYHWKAPFLASLTEGARDGA
jgi:pre-rRNA-processing protein TSR3